MQWSRATVVLSRRSWHSQGGFWGGIEAINDNFEYVGYSIILFFACSAAVAATAWAVSSRRAMPPKG